MATNKMKMSRNDNFTVQESRSKYDVRSQAIEIVERKIRCSGRFFIRMKKSGDDSEMRGGAGGGALT